MSAERGGDCSVRVTLTFDTTIDTVLAHLGDDFGASTSGVTVESTAAALLRAHDPKLGYIRFDVRATPDSGSCLPT